MVEVQDGGRLMGYGVGDELVPPVRAKVRQRVTKQVTRQQTKKARGKRDRLSRAKGWVPGPDLTPGGEYGRLVRAFPVKVGEWRYVDHGEAQSPLPMLIAQISRTGLVSCVKPNMFCGRFPKDRRAGWCAGYISAHLDKVSISRVPSHVVNAIIQEIGQPPHAIGKIGGGK